MTAKPVGRPVTKEPSVKPEFITMDVSSGESIGDASRRAVKMADHKQCPIRFTFAGIEVEARPDEDPWECGNRWFKADKLRKRPSHLESMLRIKLGTDPGVEECQS